MRNSALLERFGKRFRRVGIQRRVSVRALARRAGVDARTIRELEAGRFDPPLDTMLGLADGVGVPGWRLLVNITDQP